MIAEGDSYELAFFETEIYLKNLLRLDEMTVNTLLDRVWNFYKVSLELPSGQTVILRDDQDVLNDWDRLVVLEEDENADSRRTLHLR